MELIHGPEIEETWSRMNDIIWSIINLEFDLDKHQLDLTHLNIISEPSQSKHRTAKQSQTIVAKICILKWRNVHHCHVKYLWLSFSAALTVFESKQQNTTSLKYKSFVLHISQMLISSNSISSTTVTEPSTLVINTQKWKDINGKSG